MTSRTDLSDARARSMRRENVHIKTEAVPCTIMTTSGLMEGELHKRGTYRVIDELNTVNAFIAVTNVKIHSSKPARIYETDFVALRADQIIWVRPVADEASLGISWLPQASRKRQSKPEDS